MKIDPDVFFAQYKIAFDEHLSQYQVEGLNEILGLIETDAALTKDVRFVAYVLATVKLECGNEWHPIEEYGKGQGHSYGVKDAKTGQAYYGRGYTQNTWKFNYDKLTKAWNAQHPSEPVDFVNNPYLLLIARYSWFCTSFAMLTGLYTGKKLSDYITEHGADYDHARRIVNGMDAYAKISKYAKKFEAILMQSVMTLPTDGLTGAVQGAVE